MEVTPRPEEIDDMKTSSNADAQSSVSGRRSLSDFVSDSATSIGCRPERCSGFAFADA
jgi:hypothetical protein